MRESIRIKKEKGKKQTMKIRKMMHHYFSKLFEHDFTINDTFLIIKCVI